MASVKCPKCNNLITNVYAGQTVKCAKCGNTMKIAPPSDSVTQQSNVQTQTPSNTVARRSGKGTKVIGIILIIVGVIGLLMGMMMFGDIGVACIIGALSALLSGIGFISIK